MMARQRLLPAMLLAMTTGAVADLAGQQGTDPFLWLEEVEGQRAMEWVLARNAETRAALQASPARFATSSTSAPRAILRGVESSSPYPRTHSW